MGILYILCVRSRGLGDTPGPRPRDCAPWTALGTGSALREGAMTGIVKPREPSARPSPAVGARGPALPRRGACTTARSSPTLHPPPHAARTSARSRQPLCSCLHAVMMAWALLHPPQPQRPAMLQPLIGLGYTGLDIPPASGGTLPASTSGHQDMTSQASTDILLEMLLLPISPTFSIFCRAQAAMLL